MNQEHTIKGICLEVIDGDTIRIDLNGLSSKVRLLGIDAPEINDYGAKAEFAGNDASTFLRRMVEGVEVIIKFESKTPSKDKHGRILGYVYISGDIDIQEELIKVGLARVYKFFNFHNKSRYVKLENIAKKKKLGIWS